MKRKKKEINHDENDYPSFLITTQPKVMIFGTKSISFPFPKTLELKLASYNE